MSVQHGGKRKKFDESILLSDMMDELGLNSSANVKLQLES